MVNYFMLKEGTEVLYGNDTWKIKEVLPLKHDGNYAPPKAIITRNESEREVYIDDLYPIRVDDERVNKSPLRNIIVKNPNGEYAFFFPPTGLFSYSLPFHFVYELEHYENELIQKPNANE